MKNPVEHKGVYPRKYVTITIMFDEATNSFCIELVNL